MYWLWFGMVLVFSLIHWHHLSFWKPEKNTCNRTVKIEFFHCLEVCSTSPWDSTDTESSLVGERNAALQMHPWHRAGEDIVAGKEM